MKQLMHICFTSKNEVLCRCERDCWMMVSRIAQAAVYNDTNVLAYSVMSNHVHLIVMTDRPERFVLSIRGSYNQSFNHIYRRRGALGEKGFFRLHIEGRQHSIAALTYVLQNPWHHKVMENPFDYPFSSMNLYFRRNREDYRLKDVAKNARLLNRNVVLPETICYGDNGRVAPVSFVEVEMVENVFGTYNAFNYLTHRKNYDEMKNEQLLENDKIPYVSLRSVEPLLAADTISNLERGSYRWNKSNSLSDLDLCKVIDTKFVPKCRKQSYAELTDNERNRIMMSILEKYRYRVTEEQLKRCLAKQ